MAIPLLDLKLQYTQLKDDLDAAVNEVMSTAYFIGGPKVKALETAIAEYCGTEHAVPCGNGTDALFLILAAMGIGKGDEVITTPFTFFATVEAIVHVGATPVFVDIEPGTYNMDITKLEAAITDKTKAIMYYHDAFGTNSRHDAIQAAIMLVKLPHLDGWNAERRAAAAAYGELLAGVEGLELPVARDFGDSVYHLYIVKTATSATADKVIGALKDAGIGTALYYPLALHEQEALATLKEWEKPSLPVAESCDNCTFALPAFPGITAEQIQEVAAVVKGALA
jgi:dTDP-4-amino-4,6-dideoxygalactose transaminase